MGYSWCLTYLLKRVDAAAAELSNAHDDMNCKKSKKEKKRKEKKRRGKRKEWMIVPNMSMLCISYMQLS